MKPIAELLQSLKITANDENLFISAFTHPSHNGEAKTHHRDYERIEFIGDSVVNFVVADLIYHYHMNAQEGTMSKMRAALVQRDSLAEHARKLSLGDYIMMGHGMQKAGGADSNKILEDVFEAFFGAVYLDQGFATASRILRQLFEKDVRHFHYEDLTDYKTRLQEEMQADHRANVHYEIVETSGPSHAPIFVAEVYFQDVKLGRGSASSKKEAEQLAAKDALDKKAV